jgi:hypothetical protein
MMQNEIEKLNERVAWLERKMVRVLRVQVISTSALIGAVVAYTIDKSLGWPSVLVATGIFLRLSSF